MLEIPLDATVNQELLITLNDQDCTLAVYQRGDGMFLDLHIGQTCIQQGAICQSGMGIIQVASNAFQGQLVFLDTRTQADWQQPPQYTELGTRWVLYYLTPDEWTELEGAHAVEALNVE